VRILRFFLASTLFVVLSFIGSLAQVDPSENQLPTSSSTKETGTPSTNSDTEKPSNGGTSHDLPDAPQPMTARTVAQQKKDLKDLQDALSADSDLDFSLVVGIGSLIVVSGSTDYSNEANVIHSNNIGKATPQFLAGVAFRSHLPNIFPRYQGCSWDPTPEEKLDKTPGKPACPGVEPWQKRPWSGFVSVKFSPGSSQTVNGFVFGATYAVTKYLNGLIGFSLTPINEPAPGFRTVAAQLVRSEQAKGLLLNYDADAMLKNSPNAFDGFPVTDPGGKLIYSGNPLTVHYHGGLVVGVSIPIYFSSVFK
jgi:hypothetical protein